MAADNVAAAQVRLGRMLDQRAKPLEIKAGNQMYLDASPQHSPPHQVPYKFANRWARACEQVYRLHKTKTREHTHSVIYSAQPLI
jgi:hypothetical protein